MRHRPPTEGLELAAGKAGVEAVAHRAPVGFAESLEERAASAGGTTRSRCPLPAGRESRRWVGKTSERESGPR